MNDLQLIDDSLARIGEGLYQQDASEDKRGMAVDLMNLAIDTWCSSTGLTKSAFADQSGLWRVYVTQNGHERTQTLDRYLKIETLPKRPKWHHVIQSVEFVLENCDRKSARKERLEALLVKFRNSLWHR